MEQCNMCGAYIAERRLALGYRCCLECGEEKAREQRNYWCVAGINKSNPMLITDLAMLKQLNPKRTEV